MAESRCDCGKLLFKRTKRGFEFKCNRCKRIHLIPFDWFSEKYRGLCPLEDSSGEEAFTLDEVDER